MSLLVVIVLMGTAVAATAELEWVRAPSAPISGGYGEAVVGDGTDIFLVKCLYATSAPAVYRYKSAQGIWAIESAAGLEAGAFRTGTALATDDSGLIYALVGARYEDTNRTAFLVYETSPKMWRSLAGTPHAQGAGDALAWCGQNGLLYALVGSNKHNGGRSYFLAYNPTTSTWTELAEPWDNTDDGASLTWTGDEYIYAVRGEYMETVPNGDFARYSIITGQWETLQGMPTSGGVGDGGSLLYVGRWQETQADKLYAFSGGSASEEPGYEIFSFSLTEGEWKSEGRIPCPVGYYVGNRLGYASNRIFYWQGSPQSEKWLCEGTGFYAAEISSSLP